MVNVGTNGIPCVTVYVLAPMSAFPCRRRSSIRRDAVGTEPLPVPVAPGDGDPRRVTVAVRCSRSHGHRTVPVPAAT